MLIATAVVSAAAIVLDFGLHADPTLLFVVSAIAILGLAWVVGLSTERLDSLTNPQVGGIRHGIQSISPKIAGSNAALLVLALIGLFVRPSSP